MWRSQQPRALAPPRRQWADARVAVRARGDAAAGGTALMKLAGETRALFCGAASGGGGIRSHRGRNRISVVAEEVWPAVPSSPGGRSTPPWSPCSSNGDTTPYDTSGEWHSEEGGVGRASGGDPYVDGCVGGGGGGGGGGSGRWVAAAFPVMRSSLRSWSGDCYDMADEMEEGGCVFGGGNTGSSTAPVFLTRRRPGKFSLGPFLFPYSPPRRGDAGDFEADLLAGDLVAGNHYTEEGTSLNAVDSLPKNGRKTATHLQGALWQTRQQDTHQPIYKQDGKKIQAITVNNRGWESDLTGVCNGTGGGGRG